MTTETIAYKYGLLAPLNWADDCREHLFRMNRLWNRLVEIERGHREKYRAIVGADDVVKPMQERIDALIEEQSELRKQRKLQRQKARARVETSVIDARLKEVATLLQPLKEEHKRLRGEAKERCREKIKALDSERFEAVKAARQPELSGLWWPNYNAVCQSYETARGKAMKEGAELRFRRFNGEGRFTFQLQNGASVADICGGSKRVAIDLREQPVPERGGRHLPRLSIAIYTQDGEPRMLDFPIIYDRPLPDAARIQQVVVTVRRVGTQWRYSAVFTCRVESSNVVAHRERLCGINFGFRARPDGMRVAAIYGHYGIEYHEVPKSWLSAMDAVESIAQRRDLALNDVTASLRAWWPENGKPWLAVFEHLGCAERSVAQRLGNLLKAPKFGAASLAAVTLQWRSEYEARCSKRLDAGDIPDEYAMLERLERWRKLDKKELEHQSNKREHLMASRRERYRLLARDICSRYSVIRMGKMDLRRMAKIETTAGEETELHAAARANRQRASLYELQQEIRQQAPKFGAVVELVDGSFTIACHRCGGRCAVTSDVMHVCEHCGAAWDQDENAARNIFAAPRERSNGDENTGKGSRHDNHGLGDESAAA